LSIGYRTVRGRIDPSTRIRRLYQVDLWEISIVTFPLLAGARIDAVKAIDTSRRRAAAERAWRNPDGAADVPAPSGRIHQRLNASASARPMMAPMQIAPPPAAMPQLKK